MLPSEDAVAVGQLLRRVFGLPFWQIATTATDANRFALRVARAVTGRPKILVFNGCYHGAVEETFVRLEGRQADQPAGAGRRVPRPDAETTRVVEFNDLAALEARARPWRRRLRHHRAGADQLLHGAARARLSRRPARADPPAGTLLLIDETHTISSGLGGYTQDARARPRPVRARQADRRRRAGQRLGHERRGRRRATPPTTGPRQPGYSGMGTTLSANPLQFAAMRATLEEVMTRENYAHMERLAARLEKGLAEAIARYRLPWHVARVGARVEFICAPGPLQQWRRGGSGACAGTGGGDPCRAGQSRRADRAVPQHDAGVAGDREDAGRPAGRRLRRYCGAAHGVRQARRASNRM